MVPDSTLCLWWLVARPFPFSILAWDFRNVGAPHSRGVREGGGDVDVIISGADSSFDERLPVRRSSPHSAFHTYKRKNCSTPIAPAQTPDHALLGWRAYSAVSRT